MEKISEIKTKFCGGCKLEKFTEDFHKNKNSASGLNSYCKSCRHIKILEKEYDNKGLSRPVLEINGFTPKTTFINLTGKVFGRLTVIKPISKYGTSYFWECECSCGNVVNVPTHSLQTGDTKSCGCYRKEFISQKSKKEYGYAAKKHIYNTYKYGAKRRNLEFNLSLEEFFNISQKNCAYCGVKPSSIFKSVHNNGDFIYNGIDRVDNNIGYVITNVAPCCWECNKTKLVSSLSDFYAHIIKVYIYCDLKNIKLSKDNDLIDFQI